MIKTTLASSERLQELLSETEKELMDVQPKIEALEKQLEELRELKQVKQRLITLKMSLSALIQSITNDDVKSEDNTCLSGVERNIEARVFNFSDLSTLKMFHPEKAFEEADKILKQKQSLNYEMFKAVVFKGGKASTEEIKTYLVESQAKQPQTGEDFTNVPLTEISSRLNYLIRKGVLCSAGKGNFYSTLGWIDSE